MVCAQPDGSMSSLLQSTGSRPYVLVHIDGSLAATTARICGLNVVFFGLNVFLKQLVCIEHWI